MPTEPYSDDCTGLASCGCEFCLWKAEQDDRDWEFHHNEWHPHLAGLPLPRTNSLPPEMLELYGDEEAA